MATKCELIGWLLDDNKAQVLVRDESGHICLQTADIDSTFAHRAIQTGSFQRGAPIIDPVTHEAIGYEMEHVPSPLAALA